MKLRYPIIASRVVEPLTLLGKLPNSVVLESKIYLKGLEPQTMRQKMALHALANKFKN